MYNRWEIVGTIYKLLVIYVFNVFYYCMLGSYSVYFPCLTLFVLQPAYFLLFFFVNMYFELCSVVLECYFK